MILVWFIRVSGFWGATWLDCGFWGGLGCFHAPTEKARDRNDIHVNSKYNGERQFDLILKYQNNNNRFIRIIY